MPASVTLKALGLNSSSNQLEVPAGSLSEAKNVVIRDNDIIAQRRGFGVFGQSLGSSSDRAKQLISYRDRILRYFSTKLEFDAGTTTTSDVEIFHQFSGDYIEAESGLKIKSIESNGNLYFTTSTGIKKISASSADDFTTSSGFITNAGGVKAVDLTADAKYSFGNLTGFLPQDSAVAYRVLWNYNDKNKNLVPGTPSQRAEVFNSLLPTLLQDYNFVLGALDNINQSGSLINDGNYVSLLSLPITAASTDLFNNLLLLATKLDSDILYADTVSAPLTISGAFSADGIATVSFSSGTPSSYFIAGNKVFLTGFSPNTDLTNVLNGAQIITSTIPAFSTTGTVTQGVAEVATVTTVADSGGNLGGTFFDLSNANDLIKYYVWFNVSGVGVDPAIPGKTGIRVNLVTNDTNTTVATNIAAAINNFALTDFSASVLGHVVTITNQVAGPSTDATAGTSGFSVLTTIQGVAGNIITSVASTSGVHVGSIITGTAIPSNTYVTAFTSNTITLSQNVTGTHVAESINLQAGATFNSKVTGSISLTLPTIHDNEFDSITQPSTPTVPTTNNQLVAMQTYLDNIITTLQAEPTTVISSALATAYIDALDITQSATVKLKITIPQDVTSNDFFQIYRSDIAQATGTTSLSDLTPNDELKLVYEAFPTTAELAAFEVDVEDITPDVFRGANLYTNEASGEGLAQANDLPPYAKDVNRYKNVTFYANTKTRQRKLLSLLGVVNMVTDFNNAITPKIVISNGLITNTYSFVVGKKESTKITTTAGSTLAASGTASYFFINSANDEKKYYVWYKIGTATDPAIAGRIGIQVVALAGDTNNQIASKTANTLSTYISDFSVSISTNQVTVTNINDGKTTDATAQTSGFTVLVLVQGTGEDATAKQVLLSDKISVGQAVDETARSLVRVINKNSSEVVNAYYLSTSGGIPGQIFFEERSLSDNKFYILGNNDNTGLSFNPNIGPENTIVTNTIANPTIVHSTTAHGMVNGDKVVIINSNSTPNIDGLYPITFIDSTHFSVPVHVTVAGTSGAFIKAVDSVFSDNEVKPNRIYYSKFQQPDAVPLVNFFDVGSQDKEILRIFPLRDSLFVFKEDGLFRVSGEVSPFVTALFDSSVIVVAPDSLAVSNNMIFCWTTRGIQIVTEGGVQNISNNTINNIIRPLSSESFTNFKTVTWGIGYESDNSYTVFTIKKTTDTSPQIGYRYDQITNTWTSVDKDYTCGVVHQTDDKMYVGAGDLNVIEKERKDFTRTDFCDRELAFSLSPGLYFQTLLKFLVDVSRISVGDVVVQEQLLTIYQFNQTLKKLDLDPGTNFKNYFSTIAALPGDSLRTDLINLTHKLDLDTGVTDSNYFSNIDTKSGSISAISIANPSIVTTSAPHGLVSGRILTISGSNSNPTINDTYPITVIDSTHFSVPVNVNLTAGTTGSFNTVDTDFRDIQACYNSTMAKLNLDTGLSFGNYQPSVGSVIQEAIVTDVNTIKKTITLNLALPYVEGPLKVFEAIQTSVTYSPITFSDPLSLKQVRESTMMFADKAFTNATLNFASDIIPQFSKVPFEGDGNGIFGYSSFGSGFFGGGSHGSPFRTIVPLNQQRCRYLIAQFQHGIARESYQIYGITLVGETGQSSRTTN